MRSIPLIGLASLVGTLGLSSCGDAGLGAEAARTTSSSTPQGLGTDPATGRRFVVEAGARGGPALAFGRRVDVYALDPASGGRTPVLDGLVVGPEVASDGRDFELGRSLATGRETLTILHPHDTRAFADALALAQAGIVAIDERVAVPRDAALVLALDTLLPASGGAVCAARLELVADGGAPLSARVEPGTSHGALVDGVFHGSRVVVTPQDPRGWLAGTGLAAAEVELRMPGRGLVRALTLGDAPLPDGSAPEVLGRQRGQLTQVRPTVVPTAFVVDFQFTTPVCGVALQVGDALRSAGHVAEVLAASAAPDAAGLVKSVRVGLVQGDPTTFAPAGAELRAPWYPALGAPPECYVRFLPAAQSLPASGVSTQAVVALTFSEPMDPHSVQSTGTFRVAYGTPPVANALFAHVVGAIQSAPGLIEFAFAPAVALRHAAGVADAYRVELRGGPQGVTDLAGNPLANDLPPATFTLEPSQPAQATTGVTLSFEAVDEDGDGAPELRGSALYDLGAGALEARAVTRFATAIDTTQAMVAAMPVSPYGVQTPLSHFGSKMVSGWRYVDLGFDLLDSAHHDLDVEGLAWVPWGPVHLDRFRGFQIALAHGFFLQDETTNTGLLPAYRFSGLVGTFDQDFLSLSEDPPVVVHEKAKGYTVDPADLYVSVSSNPLMPWPFNRNVPLSEYVYWTWRDTAKTALGGATGPSTGPGADPQRLLQVTGTGLVGFYPTGKLPTIALPLLTEFRCYPDATYAASLNSLRTSFALNSSFRPTFRAHSTGGFTNPPGYEFVDPDNEPVASGGPTGSLGAGLPIDNTVYHGQAEFVVRVSRAHTRWLDLGAATAFASAVLEEGLGGLPAGTQATLAFRGASAISGAASQPWLDAGLLDPYGDGFTMNQLSLLGLPTQLAFTVVPFPDPANAGWSTALSDLDGARFVQVRISLISNAETNQTPAIAGVGLAGIQ